MCGLAAPAAADDEVWAMDDVRSAYQHEPIGELVLTSARLTWRLDASAATRGQAGAGDRRGVGEASVSGEVAITGQACDVLVVGGRADVASDRDDVAVQRWGALCPIAGVFTMRVDHRLEWAVRPRLRAPPRLRAEGTWREPVGLGYAVGIGTNGEPSGRRDYLEAATARMAPTVSWVPGRPELFDLGVVADMAFLRFATDPGDGAPVRDVRIVEAHVEAAPLASGVMAMTMEVDGLRMEGWRIAGTTWGAAIGLGAADLTAPLEMVPPHEVGTPPMAHRSALATTYALHGERPVGPMTARVELDRALWPTFDGRTVIEDRVTAGVRGERGAWRGRLDAVVARAHVLTFDGLTGAPRGGPRSTSCATSATADRAWPRRGRPQRLRRRGQLRGAGVGRRGERVDRPARRQPLIAREVERATDRGRARGAVGGGDTAHSRLHSRDCDRALDGAQVAALTAIARWHPDCCGGRPMRSLTNPLTVSALLAALAFAACTDADLDDADDHALGTRTFEGDELAALFGPDGVSASLVFAAGFRRVGLLWDDVAEGAIELRTSADGLTWSDWRAPAIVSSEEGAHAGHLDAIAVDAAAGSTALDPTAAIVQLRVVAGAPRPTFLVVEPLADIPPFADPADAVPDTVDVDDGDGEGGALFSVVRPTPIGGVRIYTRADWKARAPKCGSGAAVPNRATIHHTVTPTSDRMSPQARLRQIQAFHMFTNGWCDIGYNYLVSRDGRVWRGRGARTIGAHVASNNAGNVGISFLGTYTSTRPTAKQECNAARLLRRLHMDFPGISLWRSDVKGHRQYGGTACPGNALYHRIDDILRKARSGC
jgi:hypothetical protein